MKNPLTKLSALLIFMYRILSLLILENTIQWQNVTFIIILYDEHWKKTGGRFTHDPYRLEIGKKRLEADLGAERLMSAEKGLKKIVVEVKSFCGAV
jgi:hypothetical protein